MSKRLDQLSRMIAHALRHHPDQYSLQLDEDGWVELDVLVSAIGRDPKWTGLTANEVLEMNAAAEKRRYEVHGEFIRAAYGHSFAERILHAPAVPPVHLYHGTTPEALEPIRRDGLKPMRRQFVHLSLDVETATTVAGRRTSTPVIITVNAKAAHDEGIVFHRGSQQVWLTESIDQCYLSFPRSFGHRATR